MKEFRTELIPANAASPFNLRDGVFTIGSCFADAIGNHLSANKFDVWNNRFGTIYNPVSIHQLLSFVTEKEFPSSESYLQNEGIHLNYHFHSTFSSVAKDKLEDKINAAVAAANEFLKTTNRIVITYGTAFVYRLKSSGEIVANCHKVPSANFDKSLLSESEITKSFQEFYSKLKRANPKCKIILTVSPVRHLKDTLELNAVSKSILRLACHSIISQFSDVEYFPAYEILLDDLRDYRFYKSDRLHPTDEAVEYIWEKFVAAYIDNSSQQFIKSWTEIKKDLEHKPFHPESDRHRRFLKSVVSKLENLQTVTDVSKEIQEVQFLIQNHKS